MEDLKIYYFHGTTVDDKKFTISATIDEKEEDAILALALCGNKDNFCRKIGRSISSGRLKKYERIENRYVNSVKGVQLVSLYDTAFNEIGEEGSMFSEHYYKGKENKVLYNYIHKLSFLKSNELKKEFSL